MKLALLVTLMRSGERGGAEAFYDGLEDALRDAGHAVDRLGIPVDESSFETILEAYARCADLDLRGYDAVISTKAPTYMARHRRHLSYLVHTVRVFYDMFAAEYGEGTPEQQRQRRIIQACDRHGLRPDRITRHFAIGHAPYRRLRRADPFWEGVPFEAVHLPPTLSGFHPPRAGRYVLLPGRLHRWKRVALVIEAFRRVHADVPLKIVGAGEDEAALRRAAAGDPRIEFLGRVDDATLLDLYADALVVPFVPIDEDYGLVTIEAFRSGKPVITCRDSGEPLEFVRDGINGFVVEPTPEAIAARLGFLIERPDVAATMGERGHRSVEHLTWPNVAARLLEPLEAERAAAAPRRRQRDGAPVPPLKVLITDNQCIDPAVGGGRLRLLGLYGTLTEDIEATYVGTYDWPGPGHRELTLSPRLREIDVPLSAEHFALNARLNELLPGRTIIDVTMPWLVSSSPELVDTAREHAAAADVVVFSHPWMYTCLRDQLAGQRVVYDSQNCEGLLRADLLGSTAFGRCLAEQVRAIEAELCRRSDVILACSELDRAAFVELYGIAADKIVLVPNGVNVEAIRPPSESRRAAARARLRLSGPTVIFVGSGYAPNVEALAFIVDRVAPSHPEVTFLVVGSVAEHGAGVEVAGRAGANVRTLGTVSDERRDEAYAAADLAINPMFTGSGVNIKMLDFLAAGLPTLTTPIGARGILNPDDACFVVARPEEFEAALRGLLNDAGLRARLAARGRTLVEEHYDWQRISGDLGGLLLRLAGPSVADPEPDAPPFFSVVVPTYRRPELLRELLRRLDEQTFRGFEVVIVDQSETPFDLGSVCPRFPVEYVYTEVPGATRARNLGVARARGQVVAFTDDDCQPAPTWLATARRYFRDPTVVGVEGLIESDVERARDFRVVTNVGFEGFGFMTANLFVRRAVAERVGGFDERFDRPHFREDTDFGWRVLDHGRVPFARDVHVLHPAHRTDDRRESKSERLRFFVHDPLLFHKHPDRYLDLLKAEGHFTREDTFWEYFLKGMVRHRVDIPLERLLPFMPLEVRLAAEQLRAVLAEAATDPQSANSFRPITA